MSTQYFLARFRTREGSVFNLTSFNKMCHLRLLVYMPYIFYAYSEVSHSILDVKQQPVAEMGVVEKHGHQKALPASLDKKIDTPPQN